MLKTLKINNFTVFKEADLNFSSGLNVIIGENGTGKSHLLKLGYAVLRIHKEAKENTELFSYKLEKSFMDIYKIKYIKDLMNKKAKNSAFIEITYGNLGNIKITFPHHVEITEYDKTIKVLPELSIFEDAIVENIKNIFIPTKEILSVYPGFRSALKNRELAFDDTYLDLADALDARPLRGDKLEKVKHLVDAIENIIKSSVFIENGSFYFEQKQKSEKKSLEDFIDRSTSLESVLGSKQKYIPQMTINAQMVAEGHRKLGMLAYLIKVGALEKDSSLFWDEPEANLNPKLLKALAKILSELSKVMQITIATHSLFLLRELEILQEEKKLSNARYFGLQLTDDGVEVLQGNSSNEIGDITALDESIAQSTRYLDASYEE